jgi:pimeloyl-ACP methyl ester carboxylesterase
VTIETFAEAIRTMMYRADRGARVPLLIHQAWEGNFEPFAEAALSSNRGLYSSIRIGMLQSVVCTEDGARIEEADIVEQTRGTLLGDSRVRQQLAACAVWPRTRIPADYADPVRVDTPVLMISGTRDPVTPPEWGTEAARHLPRSLHLVVPAGHTPGGPCLERIGAAFLKSGAPEGLDLNCLASERYPPFVLP